MNFQDLVNAKLRAKLNRKLCLSVAEIDSRKYPYHATNGNLEFRGEGGFMDWNFKSIGVMQFGIPIVWLGGGGGVQL